MVETNFTEEITTASIPTATTKFTRLGVVRKIKRKKNPRRIVSTPQADQATFDITDDDVITPDIKIISRENTKNIVSLPIETTQSTTSENLKLPSTSTTVESKITTETTTTTIRRPTTTEGSTEGSGRLNFIEPDIQIATDLFEVPDIDFFSEF